MKHDKYDAIVFDFDGTIVESKAIKTQAFGELYQSYGKAVVDQVITYHRQNEGVSRFTKFQYWSEKLLKEMYSEEKGVKLSRRYSKLVMDAIMQAPLLPGVLDLLDEFHQLIPMFLASGSPEAELKEIVELRHLGHYFRGIYGYPPLKEQILRNFINESGYFPKRVLMVGDSIEDWKSAKASDMHFVGILNGEKSPFPMTVIKMHDFNHLRKHLHDSSDDTWS